MQAYVTKLSEYVSGEKIQTDGKQEPKTREPPKASDLLQFKKNIDRLVNTQDLTPISVFNNVVNFRNKEIQKEHDSNKSGRTIIPEHDRGEVVRKVVISLGAMNKESLFYVLKKRDENKENIVKAFTQEHEFLMESITTPRYKCLG